MKRARTKDIAPVTNFVLTKPLDFALLEHLHICEALPPRAMSAVKMTMIVDPVTPGHLLLLATRVPVDGITVATRAKKILLEVTTPTLSKSLGEGVNPRIGVLVIEMVAVIARTMAADRVMTVTNATTIAIKTETETGPRIVREIAREIVQGIEETDLGIGQETALEIDPEIEIASMIVTATVIVAVTVIAIKTADETVIVNGTVILDPIGTGPRTRLSGHSISQVHWTYLSILCTLCPFRPCRFTP